MSYYNNVSETIGNTPLVKLNCVAADIDATVLVKMESMNPLSSVKDRIALKMINSAEASGLLKPGMTIVEPTSGNTGIGLAFVGVCKGYSVVLIMPDTMSVERRALLKSLGAELILTPGKDGMKGAVARATEIADQGDNYFMPQQFANEANAAAHRETTAQEILADTDGAVDIFVSGVGTGGTITGVGEALKAHNSAVRVVAVEPDDSAVLSGDSPGPHKIQGIGAGFVPDVLNRDIFDEVVRVTSDDSIAMARQLMSREAIVAGISSGANVVAALQVAARPENKGKTVVTIICDTGERYLSTDLFDTIGE